MLTILATILAVLIAFGRAIPGPMTLFDDPAIEDNILRGQTRRAIEWHPFYKDPRGLTHISYLWNYRIGGFRPHGWKLANIAIHTATVLIIADFGGWRWALLYAVHPLHCFSVCYTSGRAGLWNMFFFVAGFDHLWFARYPMVMLCAVLGWKSKPDFKFYVPLWAALGWWFGRI